MLVWPKVVSTKILWPKIHLTENLFDQKVVSVKCIVFIILFSVKWPFFNVFRSNDHLMVKKTYGQEFSRWNGDSVKRRSVKRRSVKQRLANWNFGQMAFGQKNFGEVIFCNPTFWRNKIINSLGVVDVYIPAICNVASTTYVVIKSQRPDCHHDV
jgi:hypothetical protein